jgi:hypothetical protein
MKVHFGGKPYPPEAGSDSAPVAENGHRPSLITPWRIEGIEQFGLLATVDSSRRGNRCSAGRGFYARASACRFRP